MQKLTAVVVALAAAQAVAFSRVPMKMSVEMSKSVPFLKKQPKLDGSMAGDEGFDPLGLSNTFDINFLRQAEIKHGRVAMIACAGVFAQMLFHLPGEMHTESNPVDAFYKVGPNPLAQILIFCGALEVSLHKGKISYQDMDCSKPGDFDWDPANLKKTMNQEEMALKEIRNGRLAMIGIGGLIHQCFVSGTPVWFGN